MAVNGSGNKKRKRKNKHYNKKKHNLNNNLYKKKIVNENNEVNNLNDDIEDDTRHEDIIDELIDEIDDEEIISDEDNVDGILEDNKEEAQGIWEDNSEQEEIDDTNEMSLDTDSGIDDDAPLDDEIDDVPFDNEIDDNNLLQLDDNVIVRDKKRKKLIIWGVLLLIGIMIYIVFPKISLKGAKQITKTYGDEYVEEGYSAKLLFKDVTDSVKIESNLNIDKVGKYKIKYYVKLGIFKFSKKRIINVIDDVMPEVIVDSDILNVCPNDRIDEIKYKAIDEYDGDITDRVIENRLDDKIVLIVSDKANNKVIKEITIDRSDKIAPEIILNGNNTIYLEIGANYVEPGYAAKDNCDGDLTASVEVSGEVGKTVGTYQINYVVSDKAGNKTAVVRTVIVRNSNLYNSGSINTGTIYLTFDDGPNVGTTDIILDVLKEQGVKATFFVTCNGPDYLIKRAYDEGHTIALHTASHDYGYIYASVDNYFNDLNKVSNRVKNIIGIEPKIIRFPGGSSNMISKNYQIGIMTTLTEMVLDKGYRYFDWNVDAMDASSARNSNDVYNNVINNIAINRANVVLMHDTKGITRDALRNIILTAKSRGYTFDNIDMDTYMIRHGVSN